MVEISKTKALEIHCKLWEIRLFELKASELYKDGTLPDHILNTEEKHVCIEVKKAEEKHEAAQKNEEEEAHEEAAEKKDAAENKEA